MDWTKGLVRAARERYLQGAEDITTTLDALYKRAKQQAGAENPTVAA